MEPFFTKDTSRFCRDSDAHLIDVNKRFTYGDGSVVQHFFQLDGIHLSDLGARTRVLAINQSRSIVKPRTHAPEQRYTVKTQTLEHETVGSQTTIVRIMVTIETHVHISSGMEVRQRSTTEKT